MMSMHSAEVTERKKVQYRHEDSCIHVAINRVANAVKERDNTHVIFLNFLRAQAISSP